MGFKKGHKSFLTPASLKKMSESRKGKMPKNLKSLHEKHRSDNSWKDKLRTSISAEKHWNWKGGITKLRVKIWHTFEYRQWRSDIFHRDDFTCQICDERGGVIEADHYPIMFCKLIKQNFITSVEEAISCEQMWDINNGRTLCKMCHKKYGLNNKDI